MFKVYKLIVYVYRDIHIYICVGVVELSDLLVTTPVCPSAVPLPLVVKNPNVPVLSVKAQGHGSYDVWMSRENKKSVLDV